MLSSIAETMISSAAALGRMTMDRVDYFRYGSVLVNLHEIVRWSVPLMKVARSNTSNVRLQRFLDQHIEEEMGHDAWLLEDLAAVKGMTLSANAASSIESTGTAEADLTRAMIAHARLLEAGDVWPLIGHMWSLESRPPTVKSLDSLRHRLRLTPEMTRTLDRHAAADPHHARQLRSLICSLSNEILAQVDLGARITAVAVIRMWLALRDRGDEHGSYGLFQGAH